MSRTFKEAVRKVGHPLFKQQALIGAAAEPHAALSPTGAVISLARGDHVDTWQLGRTQ